MSNKFKRLIIRDWRQFANVEIDFHNRLTVITGSNGAGKSTILRLLGQHFGWNAVLLATPSINKWGDLFYSSGLRAWSSNEQEATAATIGELSYTGGQVAKINVPSIGGVQYNVFIHGIQSVEGVNISSHRPVSGYQQITNIPTNALGAQQAYNIYYTETMSRYQNTFTPFSPTYRMKEAIISMAIFGPGNNNVQGNEKLLRIYDGFKEMLRIILPKSIGFKDISVRIPDVVVVTDSGEFVIDASSGGIMSLIDLSWQIFLYSQNNNEFVVIIDEPENHLHPSMQRSILNNLTDAFPGVQFVIATHSPFIVSSVKDSYVYVLRHVESFSDKTGDFKNSVSSLRLDNSNKAGTASEILRDVLGVPVTMPEWAELEVKSIASDFIVADLNSETLNALRGKLDAAGLGEYYPDALKQIVNPQ